MIAALKCLARIHGEPVEAHASMAPFKISGKESSGLGSLFSFATHPPLAQRIEALERMN
jgi:Zn-dependent protease with chaperone function